MKKIDVLIFGGQSNMQGQAEALTDVKPVEHAYEYKYCEDALVPLCNPVGEDIRYDKSPGSAVEKDTNLGEWLSEHVVGSACYGNTNLVPKFCESYVQQTDSEVLAVHVAKGSTQIAYWMPGTVGFDMIVQKAEAAIRKAKEAYDIKHIFFVWLQGESDAIAGHSKEYYKDKISLFHTALKEKLAIEKFGIIRVGCFANDGRDWEIISAQDEVCQENKDFLMLTQIATELNGQPEYMNPHIKGHYSAKGLELLGEKAGKKLGEYAKG